MSTVIAGIGSRETPSTILAEMVVIGDWCREHQVWVRSGHAPGADQAFERGAMEYCLAYLPWSSFEASTMNKYTHYKVPENWAILYEHAAKFHPKWASLKDSVRRLIARDSAQVLGLGLKSPIKAVICWTKDGSAIGGTGQALRIAQAENIPVINMFFEQYKTAKQVIAALEKLI